MKEKAYEFRKEVYLAVFKAALTLLIIVLTGIVSALYQRGLEAVPWAAAGIVGILLCVIVLIWTASKIFEMANQLEKE